MDISSVPFHQVNYIMNIKVMLNRVWAVLFSVLKRNTGAWFPFCKGEMKEEKLKLNMYVA